MLLPFFPEPDQEKLMDEEIGKFVKINLNQGVTFDENILATGECGVLFSGITKKGTKFSLKFELSGEKKDSFSKLQREFEIYSLFRSTRGPKRCFAKTINIFGSSFFSKICLDGVHTVRLLAIEYLQELMSSSLLKRASDMFLNEGQCLPDWRECILKLDDALFSLHQNGLVHGDLKPQHLKVDAFGNACIVGFGCSQVEGQRRSYRLPSQRFCTDGSFDFTEGALADGYCFGIISALPYLLMRDNFDASAELLKFEKELETVLSVSEDERFQSFRDYVSSKVSSDCTKTRKTLFQIGNLENGVQDTESDPHSILHRDFVASWLRYSYFFLTTRIEKKKGDTMKNGLISSFARDFLPANYVEEMKLLNGLFIDGFTYPDEIIQNPSLVLWVPHMGMNVFGMVDAVDGDAVAAYGGDLETRDRSDSMQCFSTFSLHTIACGGNQINATPRNQLSRFEYGRCIGGLIASSRKVHNKSRQGNIHLIDRLAKDVREMPIKEGQRKLHAKIMYARGFVPWGAMYDWNYDFAHYCGGVLPDDEIEKESRAYQAPLPSYIMDIIRARRAEVIRTAKYFDAKKPLSEPPKGAFCFVEYEMFICCFLY